MFCENLKVIHVTFIRPILHVKLAKSRGKMLLKVLTCLHLIALSNGLLFNGLLEMLKDAFPEDCVIFHLALDNSTILDLNDRNVRVIYTLNEDVLQSLANKENNFAFMASFGLYTSLVREGGMYYGVMAMEPGLPQASLLDSTCAILMSQGQWKDEYRLYNFVLPVNGLKFHLHLDKIDKKSVEQKPFYKPFLFFLNNDEKVIQ